jgi:signal transduction histidine kinase
MLAKLTQLFYSTKSSGTGLKLALVKRIGEIHSGELLMNSNFVEGTTLTLRLPMVAI